VTKRRLGVLTVACAAAASLVAGALLLTQPFSHSPSATQPPPPVSDVNASTRACLFQAPAGSPAAAPALQGLNAAAQSSKHLLVQQFTVPANVSASAMLTELAALHCKTVVAVGSQAEAQIAAQERAGKGIHYLVIGSRMQATSDVTVISPGSATAASVESAVLRITA
jgi:hypothetical protein